MKVLGTIIVITGVGIMFINGPPRRWEKGKYLQHILIEAGGLLAMIGGYWLLDK